MNKITATLLASGWESLEKPPHVLPQLIDILTGQDQELLAQQEQRWAHLAECVHCQEFLRSYLVKTIEYDKAQGNAEGSAPELLTQLTHLMHEQLKEDIPAYVDTLEELNEEEANRRFPHFAKHLAACGDCQAVVQDLHSWLSQSEEIGL
ncbi:MAG: hypothetical protein ACR2H5_21445 [Ktedonobacteraceae bacterium]